MNRFISKSLCTLSSVSLVLALMPTPGIAVVAESEQPSSAENVASTAESVASDAATRPVEGVAPEEGKAEGEPSPETQTPVDGQPTQDEKDENPVSTDAGEQAVPTASREEAPAAAEPTDDGAQVPVADDSVVQEPSSGAATEPAAAPQPVDSAAATAPSAESASAATAADETKESPDEQKDESEILSDAELSALAVELDDGQILEPEEGDIALIAQAANGWSRIWGQGALDTMQKILQVEGVFASKRGGTVIVATADGYWDALAAAGLAGSLDAPVVLTHGTALSPQARAEVARLRPERVLVMGGALAVSDSVVAELKKLCPSVGRVWGQAAPDTAVAIYRAGKGWGDTAVICTIDGYWDALSVAPFGFAKKAPIFLTGNDKQLGASSLEALRAGGFSRAIIIGGTMAVSGSVEGQLRGVGIANVQRKAGQDALDTSAEVAKWEVSEGMGLSHLTVATSGGYWDALSAAPVCGKQNSVLVLVSPEGDFRALDAVYKYQAGTVEHGHVIGGTMAIPSKSEVRIESPWALQSLSLSATSVRVGATVEAKANMIFGNTDPASIQYNFGWSRNGSWANGQWWSTMQGGKKPIAQNSCKMYFGGSGRFEVFADAMGPGGVQQTLRRTLDVYALSGVTLSGSGTSYRAQAQIGTPNNRASGVEFRFTWARQGSGASGVLRDWSADPACGIDPGSIGGWNANYTITVEARDKDGSLGKQSATLKPDAMTARAQGYSSSTGWLVMVDWTNCWVGIYRGDQGNWSRVRYSRCSVGRGDNTPIGTFTIGDKGYSFGHGYTCYYWTDYWLGSWAFHSVLYHEGTREILDGTLGGHVSAGCIRMPIEEAKYLQDNVPYGTTVVIYK